MLGEFFNNLSKMSGNYEERKLQRTEVNGLIVSTAYTEDCGYETAIIDIDGEVYPVERYEQTLKDPESGHFEWCELAKTLESVVCLGYSDFGIEDKWVKLKRKL